MRLSYIFTTLCLSLWGGAATNDGLTDVVEWDPFSLIVNGERTFIFSAEFHYQRMPVPELWLDIFQKFRANGFNTISIYFFWSYHEASKGSFDFETSGKNVQRVLDYAKEAGIWVIARAGPYINAETNAGGFALWGSDGSMGTLRTSNDTYYQSWLPWITEIGAIIAKNQITNGGPIILNQVENELQETTHSATNTLVLYMEQIKAAFRDAGIIIPLSHNEKGQRSISWSTDYQNVGGAVNIYGLDSYPGGLSCTNPDTGFSVVRNYYQWFSNYSYTQPSYFPEFESGTFSPWGGSFYDSCQSELDPAFADVYYKNNIGQRTTLLSLYMAWGGTNWGHSAAPVVYTSYDYAAPLRETRQIRDKLSQTKLIGLFTRVSTGLLKTNMIGNGTGYSVSSTDIWSWVLRNPDTQAGFTTVQQAVSSSRSPVTFDVYLNTSLGAVTASNVILNGRQSKILVTDYEFGNHTLLFSSSDVLTYGIFDVDVLVLYLQEGQTGQFAFKTTAKLTYNVYGNSVFAANSTSNYTSTSQTFTYTQGSGQTVVKFSDGALVYLLDQPSAWKFWAPPTTSSPQVKPDEQIFVLGPYLVRNASLSSGVAEIFGDNDKNTTIEVFSGSSLTDTIVWNGVSLLTTKTNYGSYVALLPGTEDRTISLPSLGNWESANSLPEKEVSYDDSKWTVCNKTSTSSPIAPLTLPVLFSSDYGYYTGPKIYRGYFDGLNYISINITCSGGLAFGWTAWLNGILIGGNPGNATATTTYVVLSLANYKSVVKLKDNLVTVVVDYHGHDETSTAKGVENPRGILGAFLLPKPSNSTGFKLWKIQGNAGGSANIDRVRGPMNEGGFYGERLGWHLPSSPSLSSSSTPLIGLNTSGITFYTTTFDLLLDPDLDVPLGIKFSAPAGTIARVMFWINGYQYGKYVPHIGPQTVFPIPPGIINNRGKNKLALSLWAMTDEGAKLDGIELVSYGAYESGFGFDRDWSYLQPDWDSGRLEYA